MHQVDGAQAARKGKDRQLRHGPDHMHVCHMGVLMHVMCRTGSMNCTGTSGSS